MAAALNRRAFGVTGSSIRLELIVAVFGPILIALLAWNRLAGLEYAVAVIVPTPLVLALWSLRLRPEWRAQEVLMWLTDFDGERWTAAGLGKQPHSIHQARAWLEARPDGSVPPEWRAGLLLAVGRIDEARAAIAAMPVATPQDVSRRLELQLTADACAGDPIDPSAADAALRSDTARTPTEIAVRLAFNAAMVSIARNGDGIAELAAARPAIGRPPAAMRRNLLFIRLRYALISAGVGVWVIACLLVAMATAGGVVWF
jgi:hypothetical protein